MPLLSSAELYEYPTPSGVPIVVQPLTYGLSITVPGFTERFEVRTNAEGRVSFHLFSSPDDLQGAEMSLVNSDADDPRGRIQHYDVYAAAAESRFNMPVGTLGRRGSRPSPRVPSSAAGVAVPDDFGDGVGV